MGGWIRGAVAVTIGMLVGLGAFTFVYARGFSYFSAEPKACVNCHIMRDEYESWRRSSHHAAAVCIDCHLPHEPVAKYLAKARNGWFHSKAFTLQDFHEPIFITSANARALRENCVRCHQGIVREIGMTRAHGAEDVDCVQCHVASGHGPVR